MERAAVRHNAQSEGLEMTTLNPSPPRRRKTDRDWNAAIDAVLAVIRPLVEREWSGNRVLAEVEALRIGRAAEVSCTLAQQKEHR